MHPTQFSQSKALTALRTSTSISRFNAGIDYYCKGRVTCKSETDQVSNFYVRGSTRYETVLEWGQTDTNQNVLRVCCDCPDFMDNSFICKHIIASAICLHSNSRSFQTWENFSPSIIITFFEDELNDADWSADQDNDLIDLDFNNDQNGLSEADKSSFSDHYFEAVNKRRQELTLAEETRHRLRRLETLTALMRTSVAANKPYYGVPAKPSPLAQVWYLLIDQSGQIITPPLLQLKQKAMKDSGQFSSQIRALKVMPSRSGIRDLNYTDEADFKILDEIVMTCQLPRDYHYHSYKNSTDEFILPQYGTAALVAKIIATKRCLLSPTTRKNTTSVKSLLPLFNSEASGWTIKFSVMPATDTQIFSIHAKIFGQNREHSPSEFICLSRFGYGIFKSGEVIYLTNVDRDLIALAAGLSQDDICGTLPELKEFISFLVTRTPRGELDLSQTNFVFGDTPPLNPKISLLRSGEFDDYPSIPAVLSMNYHDNSFVPGNTAFGWREGQADKVIFYHRDFNAETSHLDKLLTSCPGVEFNANSEINYNATVSRESFVESMLSAIESGWIVELQGKPVRASKNIRVEVSSGIDWFDVTVNADFGEGPLKGEDLLKLLRSRDKFTTLTDGSFVINTDRDLNRNAAILERFGNNANSNTFRIPKLHGILLDLEESRDAKRKIDLGMKKFLDGIKALGTLKEASAGKWFTGTLRPYQAEGLDWLRSLRTSGLGGCLADDMGLGKTIQVLALISEHYGANRKNTKRLPSLLVVPRSLVFNWQREAEKFAPGLRISELNQVTKANLSKLAAENDIIIATYQMTRRELESLKDQEFDYIILDEAQNIKNPASQVSRSVKVLNANHRLALSGTPVENHLSDITSIFEFLNPGLCAGKEFHKSMVRFGQNAEGRQMIGRVLRPFVLRRTKSQVLKDLPQKTETIIYCELSEEEKSFYDTLAKAIRAKLKSDIKTQGIGKSQIHILAALTRLRQAACDLRLVNDKSPLTCGTKIDLLIDRVSELAAEGHKSVVFSQFTGFLSLAKARLDKEKIPYCYLDGQTRNREGVVNLFNGDQSIPVFLVSLKAGGVGLNLTSASNCFLLDPWWNPAAEAQAIDRIHRIGQKNPVFAYRIIARGTVEEKILELQEQKRGLADSIMNGADEEARTITVKDLEVLIG